ncbi:MAG TPA: multiubiquitin domain-containing protein [Microthrixaceae bacterium]|nr:multiubiquitin domain-containing protein [Microthrixaceae bacterium]
MEPKNADDKGKERDGRHDHDRDPKPPKTITIVVNGARHEIPAKPDEISYEAVVELAFPGHPTGPNWSYPVTYSRGHGNKPRGTLTAGNSVKVVDGIVFNVTQTDKS